MKVAVFVGGNKTFTASRLGVKLAEELAAQGITQATIRLSIGTEHIDDLIADLTQAFAQI